MKPTSLLLLLITFSALPLADAAAQRAGRSFGIGGQLGDPSGLTLRLYQRTGFAYDLLASWDLDNYFLFNVHGVYEKPLRGAPVHYYLGPGAFVGFTDRAGDDDVWLGISGLFGLNYFIERFEIFLQLSPRLSLLPDTDGDLGGGIGLRYYF